MALVIKKTPAGVWGYQQTGQPERKDGFFYCKTDGDYFMITEGGGSQRLVSQDGDPRGKVHYTNITIDNAGVTLGPYASAAALMNALKGLNYPGFKYPQEGGGSIDQDNKPRTVSVSVVGEVTAANMAAAVNAAAEHTISEQDIVHYFDSTRGIRFRLKGVGKGTYGLGGEAIGDEVIDLIVNGTGGGGSSETNLSYDPATRVVSNDNGTGFTIPVVTSENNGLATPEMLEAANSVRGRIVQYGTFAPLANFIWGWSDYKVIFGDTVVDVVWDILEAFPADTGYNRYDRIEVDSDGIVSAVTGTETTGFPTKPAPTIGKVTIGFVFVNDSVDYWQPTAEGFITKDSQHFQSINGVGAVTLPITENFNYVLWVGVTQVDGIDPALPSSPALYRGGQEMKIYNATAGDVVLKHGASISFQGLSDFTLPQGHVATFFYDSTSANWVFSGSSVQSGGSGDLTGDVTSSGGVSTYNNVVPSNKGGAGTVNGILKANGSGTVSAATPNTDYQNPVSLTTAGTSGAATFSADNINIPRYDTYADGKVADNLTASTTVAPSKTAVNTALALKQDKPQLLEITSANELIKNTTANTLSNIFNSTLNLVAGVYEFKAVFIANSTPGSSTMGMGIMGTAALSDISVFANATKQGITNPISAQSTVFRTTGYHTVTSSSALTEVKAEITGKFRVTTGGTFTLGYGFSVDGTNVKSLDGCWLRVTKLD